MHNTELKVMGLGILTDVLSGDPTKTLYHYTTQEGLLGIINGKQIWATHTQYLNDAREYRHAIDVVTSEIEKRLPNAIGDSHRVLVDMAEGVRGIENINVCVCSFSEDRDSLSQWRGYGGSTSGYAIGFNPFHTAEMVRQEEFYLAPCLYNPREQVAVIEALIDKVFGENMERLHNGEMLVSENREEWLNAPNLFPRGGNLRAYLNQFAPILKHQSFSEERKWRIISRPLWSTHERFSFRPGKSMLIPYYRVPLARIDQLPKIDEVVVGPTPHIEQSCVAVRNFLVRQKFENVPVEPSAVPYRNW